MMNNRPTLSASLLASLLAGATALAALPAIATEPVAEPALEALRELANNPALRDARTRRRHAELVTGSIVRAHGRDAVLYHLPDNGGALRLHGETAVAEWTMPVAEAQLAGKVSLRIAYTNAVSVMPEASNLTVAINGATIGSRPIQSPDRPRQLTFDVPSHLLAPGLNAVRVTARQRHRVDCSIDATHELWTQIDASRTGFVFEMGNSVLDSLDALAAIARNKAGQMRLRVLAPGALDETQVERSLLLAQHAAVFAGFHSPSVEVAGSPGHGPGLDVFMGTLDELRRVAPDYAGSVDHSSALQVLSRDGTERVALVMLELQQDAATDAELLRRRLSQLFPKRPLRGSPQGLQLSLAQAGMTVPTGTPIALERLGITSQEFDGRLFRRAMTVRLPADFYAADYAQATLNLATAYAGGLSRDNKFIVRVNGVTATGFALSRPGGYVHHDKQLRLPLSAFRPGANEVELEVQLGRPGEKACDVAEQLEGEKRFVLSGRSTITFPDLAHLARLPDLAGTVATGFPYVVAGKARPMTLAVPKPGYAELSVAASFATQLAVRAGTALEFDLAYRAPDDGVRNAVIVGALDTLPPVVANGIEGIDIERFRSAWLTGGPTMAHARPVDPGVDMRTTAGIVSARPPATRPPSVDPLKAWGLRQPKVRSESGDELGFRRQFSDFLSATVAGAFPGAKATPLLADTDVDLLVTQRMAPRHPDGVWTLITARDRDRLLSGARLISRASVRERLRGQTVAIDGIDQTVTSSVASQGYVQMRGFSLRNAQLITAGWFSNNHVFYTLLMLGLLVGGGVVSTLLLRTVGVRHDGERVE